MIKKEEHLKELLRGYQKVAIAFSSGVDSTYLLKVASETLPGNVIAITATSSAFPKREYNESKDFCIRENIPQFFVNVNELQIDGFRENPKNRCYICKHAIFSAIKNVAKEQGFNYVLEGSNMDDLSDYRPGLVAIKELDVKSPLQESKLYKEEIRGLSKILGLPTYSKPSFACLATRFVYGEAITDEKLHMVEQAEDLLMSLGFEQMRVRIHDKLARIEVLPKDLDKIMEPSVREKVYTSLKEYGFEYVSLDMKGYRTGSMNETLSEEELKKGKIC